MSAAFRRKRPRICPLSPAHLVGLTAFELSALFLFLEPRLAPLPLLAFVLSCAVGLFCPRFRLFLPVVREGNPEANRVALTFDDGPDPAATPRLLELLAEAKVPATFFIAGAKAERHPELVREILGRGHAVGNNAFSRRLLLAAAPAGSLRREIEATQSALAVFGIVPLAYRPPRDIVRPALWRILLELGMFCVVSSLRPGGAASRAGGDRGARAAADAVPGDIIALSGAIPAGGDAGPLVEEVAALIRGLGEKGIEIVPLPALIGKDVMRRTNSPAAANPVEIFYDGLAQRYDDEQFNTNVAIAKRAERALFSARLPGLVGPADRVLEVGAGTGIFTLPLARRCREIVALDISPRMLRLLERKANAEGISNIRTIMGDAEETEIPGTFTAVCAFSSFEYFVDLASFFRRLAPHVEPGGALYFTTARRSLFRLATQIGNAMRQGLWLKAYSRKEIEAMLSASGFEDIDVRSHLLKSWLSGGMLLETVARRARGRNV